eukprot:symbB.v1.2.016078.t1/scaffold1216.1/size131131/4
MAITCPSWGSTCPLWLASNQYGQDLKARAHKSEFAASTSLIFQLRNLKSPEISETFSRNLSLFPNFQPCFRRHPRCRAEECGHSKGNWSPSVFPQAKLWTWADFESRAISVPKNAQLQRPVRDAMQLQCASRVSCSSEGFRYGFAESSFGRTAVWTSRVGSLSR